jgi:hypothetical protein
MAQTHYRAGFKKALLQFITEPDLLEEMSRETAFFPMRHLGQDVPYKVDFAALPGGAQLFFLDREFRRHPAVADILRRTPKHFTSNHAPFFSGRFPA